MRRCIAIFVLSLAASFAGFAGQGGMPPVVIDYFHEAGCPDCVRVGQAIMPELESRYEGFYVLNKYDVGRKSNAVALFAYQQRLNVMSNAPVMMVVDYQHVFNGFHAIEKGLFPCIDRCVERRLAPGWEPLEPIPLPGDAGIGMAEERMKGFTLPAVLAAGFADGINPCAIGTLVFFMSLLFVSGVRGRRLLLVGIPFCVASFVTYTAIGFGLMRCIHACEGFPVVREAVEAGLIALLGVFAFLSFLDAYRYRRSGNPADVTLQIPRSIKERIHSIMRYGIRRRNLIAGSLLVGALVTVLEGVCTGQVYVPTLVLIVTSGETGARALVLLLLYNFMFIVPFAAVFVVVYRGLKTESLLNWSKRNVFAGKILLGLLFVALAVLLSIV